MTMTNIIITTMTQVKIATKKLTRTESTVPADQQLGIHVPRKTRFGIAEAEQAGQVSRLAEEGETVERLGLAGIVGIIHTMTTFMKVNQEDKRRASRASVNAMIRLSKSQKSR